MIKRYVAGVLGVLAAGNGAVMMGNGPAWFAAVPGVADTGPFNPHFVMDVGAAFIVCGLALAAFAWRAQYRLAAVTGAGFFAVHGLVHLAIILSGRSNTAVIDWAFVILPAALGVWSVLPEKQKGKAYA